MSSNRITPKDHLARVKEYCNTLENKQDAKALLDLALQTSLGPEALELLRQRILTEGISWNWITASIAEIMYAEIELHRMIEANRDQAIAQQKELLDQYREDLLAEQKKINGGVLSQQEDILKRTNLLVHSLGPKEKIAHEFVRAILDQIIQTTHQVWAEKASEQTRILVENFSVTNQHLIDRIEIELQTTEEKAKSIAFSIGDHLEHILSDRLEAFDSSTSRNLVAYKAHLTSTAASIKSALEDFKTVRLQTQWISLLKGPLATVVLVVASNALTLWVYHWLTHP